MLLTNLTSVTNKSKKTVLRIQIPELYKTVFRTDNHKPKVTRINLYVLLIKQSRKIMLPGPCCQSYNVGVGVPLGYLNLEIIGSGKLFFPLISIHFQVSFYKYTFTEAIPWWLRAVCILKEKTSFYLKQGKGFWKWATKLLKSMFSIWE